MSHLICIRTCDVQQVLINAFNNISVASCSKQIIKTRIYQFIKIIEINSILWGYIVNRIKEIANVHELTKHKTFVLVVCLNNLKNIY